MRSSVHGENGSGQYPGNRRRKFLDLKTMSVSPMHDRRVASGTEWESIVGYSRALRRGPHVHVSGTTATDKDGEIVGVGDPARQMRKALANVESALERAGATLSDVIRTRIYVTDIDQWEEIGRVHGEVFAEIRPASSMVEVSRLVDPEMLVEVEAVAYVGEAGKG